MNYKILACDLDGTLLDRQGRISAENLSAIEELTRLGGYFVPSTGRSYSELPAPLAEHPSIRFTICSGGASLIDRSDMSDHGLLITADEAEAILRTARAYRCHVTLRVKGKCYQDIAQRSPEAYRAYNLCAPHISVLENYGHAVPSLDGLISDGIEMASLFFADEEELRLCEGELCSLGLQVVNSWSSNIEIFSANAGKGNALMKLADLLGIDRGATVAMGDSLNDLSMIISAGLGLAVENACAELKEYADGVICDNDSHAVRFALNEYFTDK